MLKSHLVFVSELVTDRLLTDLSQDIVLHLGYIHSKNMRFLEQIQVSLRVELLLLELNFAFRLRHLEASIVHVIKGKLLFFSFQGPVIRDGVHLRIGLHRQLCLLKSPSVFLLQF